jgi:hypothetical protein
MEGLGRGDQVHRAVLQRHGLGASLHAAVVRRGLQRVVAGAAHGCIGLYGNYAGAGAQQAAREQSRAGTDIGNGGASTQPTLRSQQLEQGRRIIRSGRAVVGHLRAKDLAHATDWLVETMQQVCGIFGHGLAFQKWGLRRKEPLTTPMAARIGPMIGLQHLKANHVAQ